MLRITIEVIPHGIGKPKVIKQFFIANDGTGTGTSGNYIASYRRSFSGPLGLVRGYPRKKLSVLRLVAKAANSLCDAAKAQFQKKKQQGTCANKRRG